MEFYPTLPYDMLDHNDGQQWETWQSPYFLPYKHSEMECHHLTFTLRLQWHFSTRNLTISHSHKPNAVVFYHPPQDMLDHNDGQQRETWQCLYFLPYKHMGCPHGVDHTGTCPLTFYSRHTSHSNMRSAAGRILCWSHLQNSHMLLCQQSLFVEESRSFILEIQFWIWVSQLCALVTCILNQENSNQSFYYLGREFLTLESGRV